jgi:CubicO group peptidase (beta-lactamase class C family)
VTGDIIAPTVVPVGGLAEGDFAPLSDILSRIVAAQGRGGAALCIYRAHDPVVDLVAGDYDQDSVQLLFSISKLVTTVAVVVANESGLVDLDAPLGDYWPAFRRPATARMTLRMVMAHRAGLPVLTESISFPDFLEGRDEQIIEKQDPLWEPGTRHGYHAFTFGTLVGGAFVRTVGQSVRDFVASRLSGPLGLDLWLGMPVEQQGRVKPVVFEPSRLTPRAAQRISSGAGVHDRIGDLFTFSDGSRFNDPRFLASSLLAASGVGGARDLARLLASCLDTVDGRRLISDRALIDVTTSRSRGLDEILGIETRFGTGVQLPFPQLPFLGPSSFGHEAAGGSVAFADRELGIAVGFTTNVFPPMMGASTGLLGLLPSIRHCASGR